jgi:hypothetical protein
LAVNNSLSTEAIQVGLEINVTKTEYMVFNQPIEQLDQQIMLGNSALTRVQDFKYLGAHMASTEVDLNHRRGQAMAAFSTLRPIWSAKHIDVRLKINIYKVAILSIFLYGCETWTLTQELETSINSFGTHCPRNIKGYRRLDKIPNKQLYAETNEKPLILTVRQRQLRHLGHLLRLDSHEPVRTFALYEPKHGSVKRGRPRARFVPYVAKLITNSVETTATEIETLAQNRTCWRDNIVAGAGKYVE